MALTCTAVREIFSRPEANWRMNKESPITHTFAVGYDMLWVMAREKVGEQLSVATKDGIGIIYTFKVDDLPGLEEETVKQLGRMGWFFDEESSRMAYPLTPKLLRIT